MISVIFYGRNDAHGYNLHRRAALSLNCVAEVLIDPDDEIIFVDYNTPDELPTFIEAISDTLTERCLGLMRVLRVRAAIHEEHFASHTHLLVNEPVARNAGVRRANPANQWLLHTNTDMLFVPLGEQSLSEICGDLPEGFYGLPRFELPEWLWERLPRADPRRALAEIAQLGPGLRLDEPTLSHDWIRFDAPGDFQLFTREDFAAIDGFDERMILGFHVDSNICRRMLLHRGAILSLEGKLAGYHCNHNRTRTVLHGSKVRNDLDRFFFSVDAPDVEGQRDSWGLAGVELEEVPISERVGTEFAGALVDVIPEGPRVLYYANEAQLELTYDSGHVLGFIADSLVIAPPDSTIGYIGANPVLRGMLASLVDGLGGGHHLAVAELAEEGAVDELSRIADMFVVDLGLDVSQVDASTHTSHQDYLPEVPAALARVVGSLERLIELEREYVERKKHPRLVMFVNSSASCWEAYIESQFDCSYTTFHSRVRRATVKSVVDDAETGEALSRVRTMMRWSARRYFDRERLAIQPGQRVNLVELQSYHGFGSGWAVPEDLGIWTLGPRADLRIAVDGFGESQHALTFGVSNTCVEPGASLAVELLANGKSVATRRFSHDTGGGQWRVDLPAHVVAAGEVDLTFLVTEPRSPLAVGWNNDRRELGILLRSVLVGAEDRGVELGESIAFTTGSASEGFLGEGWSGLETTGVWTVGDRSQLVLDLPGTAADDLELQLDASPFVLPEHPELNVEVWAREQQLAARVFRHGEPAPPLMIPLAGAVAHGDQEVTLELRIRDPARPVDAGFNSDPRLLGLHLRSLTLRHPSSEPSPEPSPTAGHDTLRKLRRRVTRSLGR